MAEPKYPCVTGHLVDEDGNASTILRRVQTAVREAGVEDDDIEAFVDEATSADYDHLLRTVLSTVSVAEKDWVS
jgi:hypothetical protein